MPLTGSLCMWDLHNLVSGLSPLQARVGELEEARELLVGRLS